MTEIEETPRWTVAYRKPKGNRFRRVDGVALHWDAATELALDLKAAVPELEVYYVPTRAAEVEGWVDAEDIGNILVPTGKRVKILEGGVLPPGTVVNGVVVPEPGPRLTSRQQIVLDALKEFKRFPGFILNNRSETIRVLEGLAKRGLVMKTTKKVRLAAGGSKTHVEYTLPEA